MEDTIDIHEEKIEEILEDPDKYKDWFIQILSNDTSKLATKVRTKLESNLVDSELDILLRRLENIVPYNILIPTLRNNLGLDINTDQDCIDTLQGFKQYLGNDDQLMLDKIIDYVGSKEGTLDMDIVPEIDLWTIINQLPIEKLPQVHNCVDYIQSITEVED